MATLFIARRLDALRDVQYAPILRFSFISGRCHSAFSSLFGRVWDLLRIRRGLPRQRHRRKVSRGEESWALRGEVQERARMPHGTVVHCARKPGMLPQTCHRKQVALFPWQHCSRQQGLQWVPQVCESVGTPAHCLLHFSSWLLPPRSGSGYRTDLAERHDHQDPSGVPE